NLFDATSIGIGAIIGAGIFVVLGIAIGYAGPSVIISIVIAGIVASFTAFSFAELGSAIPKQGGVYAFVYELMSPFPAFVIGCLWLFGQIVAGAAISLGLASYVVAIFPFLSVKIVALSTALLLTGLNLVGTKQSATVNNILVLVKMAILCLFIGFSFSHVQLQHYSEFVPNGFSGILQGAGFIFFAYLGFGRIATLSEEVKNPERTLPRAILMALTVSIVIYLLTAFTAIGLEDYRMLAQSGSPIVDAAETTGNLGLVSAVSFGALVATVSVLLTTLIGLSRVSFAMSRNGQLPMSVSRISSRFGTPYVSIALMGALMVAIIGFLDLRQTVAITSFSILLTHVILNFCAFRLRRVRPNSKSFKSPFYPILPLAGMGSCLILLFSLPLESWITATVVVAISSGLYLFQQEISKNKVSRKGM
ncbi:amino acid permease, partial [Candidatus Bathyarchaeota archaeon]|nr:amino acid permease [Candidatus Bathyarchaeota archaeon]